MAFPQEVPPQNPPAGGTAPAQGQTPPRPPAKPGQPKPYSEVVTAEAKTQDGLFKVHRIDEKVLWEIPVGKMNRDLLWQSEVAELPAQLGWPGFAASPSLAAPKVVQFSRRGNKVYLRSVEYNLRTSDQDGLKIGIEANSIKPIIAAFNVEAEGPNQEAVIDVSAFFISDPSEFQIKQFFRAAGPDPSKSYVDKVTAFPSNIETRSLLSFTIPPRPSYPGTFSGDSSVIGPNVSMLVHYSLVELPEKPMMPRFRDSRVGYFGTILEYYSANRRAKTREIINRYRLEKKDPTAAISEPVQPIVFYLSREVPSKWRPYIKKGVEDWNVAFEQAGFKNAIIAKDAPSLQEDPTWDPEDARYSVIRWAPSRIANAQGPHLADPRSGETISAHIMMWHNIIEILEQWYFSQMAATDPAARKMPFSDDLMGRLIGYVVAHEVGHTLGLEHNMKASSSFTVAQLRDPKFTNEHGISPSIMDYSRFNYVAQPEDGPSGWPRIGAYDKFAIEWGYKPIPGANTPEDEAPVLDQIAARQVTNPTLRFGNYNDPLDPTNESEDIGDDPIEATRLGLKNIRRIAKLMIPASTKFGEDYSNLADTYETLRFQILMELLHVALVPGGVVTTNYHAGRGGDVYKPVPRAQQQAAVKFLFGPETEMPKEMIDPNVLSKIGGPVVGRGTGFIFVNFLLANDRLASMFDNEAKNGKAAYTVAELLADMQDGLWRELNDPKVSIGAFRRPNQRSYLRSLDQKLNGAQPLTDLRPLIRASLKALAVKIDKAIPRAADAITAQHLADCRREVEKVSTAKSEAAIRFGATGRPTLTVAEYKAMRRDTACFASMRDLMKYFIVD